MLNFLHAAPHVLQGAVRGEGGGGGWCDAVNCVDRGGNEMHVNEMCIRERVLAGDTV